MTPAIVAAAPAPAALTQTLPMTVQASSPHDLERLRSLVSGTQTGENVNLTPPAAQVENDGMKTFGDSILEGVSKFNSGYNDRLTSITDKLAYIADTNSLDIGNNFAQMMGLQVEIAQWSMSVMGVDNASKAGTNTVKELSKGG
jgi:hypothetical protein